MHCLHRRDFQTRGPPVTPSRPTNGPIRSRDEARTGTDLRTKQTLSSRMSCSLVGQMISRMVSIDPTQRPTSKFDDVSRYTPNRLTCQRVNRETIDASRKTVDPFSNFCTFFSSFTKLEWILSNFTTLLSFKICFLNIFGVPKLRRTPSACLLGRAKPSPTSYRHFISLLCTFYPLILLQMLQLEKFERNDLEVICLMKTVTAGATFNAGAKWLNFRVDNIKLELFS